MKEIIAQNRTGVICHVFLPDATNDDNSGRTGLTNATANLSIVVMRPGDAAPTVYSGANIETITTIGTWVAPTAGRVRIREISAANMPGWYELQFENALFATTASSLGGMITCTNLIVATPFAIQFSDPFFRLLLEGSEDLLQALRLIRASGVGKCNGGGTPTMNFRDAADSKNRITASVDANGNRTAVTVDGT